MNNIGEKIIFLKNFIINIINNPRKNRMRKKYNIFTMDDYFKEKDRIDFIENKFPLFIEDENNKQQHINNLEYLRTIGNLVPPLEFVEEKKKEKNELKSIIIDNKDIFDEKYKNEIAYLKKINDLKVFPYDFYDKYFLNMQSIEVKHKNHLKYIMHKNEPVFFPKSYSDEMVLTNYIQLIMEQDKNSPHLYFSEKVNFEGGIFVDVGSAEGIISLDVIKSASEVFLFERSKEWIKALNNTFKPYKDKVHIIPYYAGGYDSGEVITLDTVLKKYNNENIFIKIDVEGMEIEVLRGCKNTIKNNNCKFSCACYHTKTMEKRLEDAFCEMGYKTEISDGYMLFIYGDMTLRNGMYERMEYPYFRKGLVRAYLEKGYLNF